MRGLVQLGPAPIQTAEDARMAYLREQIDFDELQEILAYHGVSAEPTSLVAHPNSFDRVDDAFHRRLPDVADVHRDKLEDTQRRLEAKDKARQAASDAAPTPKDVKAESTVKVVVDPNQPSKEAYNKVFEKEVVSIEEDKRERVEKDLKEMEDQARKESSDASASKPRPSSRSSSSK